MKDHELTKLNEELKSAKRTIINYRKFVIDLKKNKKQQFKPALNTCTK